MEYGKTARRKENGKILGMNMTMLLFNIRRGMSGKKYMQNKSNTTMTCSPTSVEIHKDYMQKPAKLLFRKETLPLPEEKTPKILAERFHNFLHQRLKRS